MFWIFLCCLCFFFFFFKQKTAYEMRISDWSSDVCSSDLELRYRCPAAPSPDRSGYRRCASPWRGAASGQTASTCRDRGGRLRLEAVPKTTLHHAGPRATIAIPEARAARCRRSEEHTSELQQLIRNSYAVFCLKKQNTKTTEQV